MRRDKERFERELEEMRQRFAKAKSRIYRRVQRRRHRNAYMRMVYHLERLTVGKGFVCGASLEAAVLRLADQYNLELEIRNYERCIKIKRVSRLKLAA